MNYCHLNEIERAEHARDSRKKWYDKNKRRHIERTKYGELGTADSPAHLAKTPDGTLDLEKSRRQIDAEINRLHLGSFMRTARAKNTKELASARRLQAKAYPEPITSNSPSDKATEGDASFSLS